MYDIILANILVLVTCMENICTHFKTIPYINE